MEDLTQQVQYIAFVLFIDTISDGVSHFLAGAGASLISTSISLPMDVIAQVEYTIFS